MKLQEAFILKKRTVRDLRKYGKLSVPQTSQSDNCSKKKRVKLRTGKRNAKLSSGKVLAHRPNVAMRSMLWYNILKFLSVNELRHDIHPLACHNHIASYPTESLIFLY